MSPNEQFQYGSEPLLIRPAWPIDARLRRAAVQMRQRSRSVSHEQHVPRERPRRPSSDDVDARPKLKPHQLPRRSRPIVDAKGRAKERVPRVLALLGRGSWETLLRIICGPEELGWPYQVVTTVEGQTSSQHVAQAQAAVAAGRFSLLFLGSWRG